MEFRQLTYLDAVIETGTFAAAADREHVAQPALWLQVRALEREWGVPLFVRQGRGVRPTLAALALRHRLRVVLGDAEALGAEVRAFREGDAGAVRIPTSPYLRPAMFFARCVAEYARRHPLVPLPTRVPLGTANVYDALEQGKIDLTMGVPSAERAFASAPLYDVSIVAVGRGLPRGPIEVKELSQLAVAVLTPDFGSRRVVEEAIRAERRALRVVYEDVYPESLIELARQGLAVAVLVSDALPERLALPIVEVRHRGRSMGGTLSLLWRDEGTLSTAAKRFRDIVLELAAARPALLEGSRERAKPRAGVVGRRSVTAERSRDRARSK